MEHITSEAGLLSTVAQPTPATEPSPSAEKRRPTPRAVISPGLPAFDRLVGERNMRRHWLRDAVRIVGLVAADVSAFLGVRALVRLVRDAQVLGWKAAALFEWLWPRGTLSGFEFLVTLIASLAIAGAYGSGDRRRDPGPLLSGAALAAALMFYPLAWAGNAWAALLQWGTVVAAFALLLTLERLIVDWVVNRLAPRVVPVRTVLVTHAAEDWLGVSQLIAAARAGRSRILPVGSVSASRDATNGNRALSEIGREIEEHGADTVLVTGPIGDRDFAFVVDTALTHGCQLLAASRTTRVAGVEPRALWMSGRSYVELTAPGLKAWQLALKRLVDVSVSGLALALLCPVLVAVGVLVKLDSRGPVLFGHRRLGARGRVFKCYKFRSMRQDAEQVLKADVELYRMYVENDYKLPAERDPRLTRVGRFLRKYSLDELPQLLNVFLGQMSLVGPRPIVPEEIDHYGHTAPLFLSLKPGMTGNWAVSGRSDVGYPDRVDMELRYVRQWSLLRDVGVLARTIPAVLRQRGAH